MKFLAILGCLGLVSVACHGGPGPLPVPQPSPIASPSPAPPPAPPPTPLADVSGTWVGSIDFNPTDQRACPLREDIRVELYQYQSRVGGTTSKTRCWDDIWLRGKLHGNVEGTGLSVELWTGGGEKITTLNGIASSAKVDVARRSLQNKGFPVALLLTR
jgi:hypothetical protein